MIEKVSKILSDYEMEIPKNVKDFIEQAKKNVFFNFGVIKSINFAL